MPEGDTLHRVARRLHVLVGQRVEAESPNPRGLVTGVAQAVDGRMLEHVEAVGKNLLLHFDGPVVVRSHLRMNGRWRVRHRGDRPWRGSPWLVLRSPEWEATQWNGPVLGLGREAIRSLGPDLLAPGTDPSVIVSDLRSLEQARLVGEALVDQRIVAGIGNMWLAEALWHARVSPWASLGEVSDEELRQALTWARDEMRTSIAGRRPRSRAVYRKAGRGCPRCGEPIRSLGLGAANRTAYWCPACQPAAATEREGFEPSTSGLPPVTP